MKNARHKNSLTEKFKKQIQIIENKKNEIDDNDPVGRLKSLKEGYKLILIDKSQKNEKLFSFLKKHHKDVLTRQRDNPYLSIANICLPDTVDKSSRGRFGQILYLAVQKDWDEQRFIKHTKGNIHALAKKGAELFAKNNPSSSAKQCYALGRKELLNKPVIGVLKLNNPPAGKKLSLYIGRTEKGNHNVDIRYKTFDKKIIGRIVRLLGKEILKEGE
jgi:hypothetical protein